MKTAAVTGHTSGLGKYIKEYLESCEVTVTGFSFSCGCDLRNYAHVTEMIEIVKNFDIFINSAKPDYAQSQILYRLIGAGFKGKILNIGSPVVHNIPQHWTDLGLLEYATQKTALYHSYQLLSKFYPDQVMLWDPTHNITYEYVSQCLKEFNF